MRFTVGRKLISGFVGVAIVFGFVAAISIVEIRFIASAYSQLINSDAQVQADALQIQYLSAHQVSLLRDRFVSNTGSDQTKIDQDHTTLEALVKQALALNPSSQVQQTLKTIAQLDDDFTTQADSVIELSNTNVKQALSQANDGGLFNYGDDLATSTQTVVQHETSVLQSQDAATSNRSRADESLVLVISIIGVLIALGLGIVITRMIAKPMVKMAEAADRIANGDLSTEIVSRKNTDEIGNLSRSLNKMSNSLRAMISQVRDTSIQVAASAEELTASSEETSTATQSIAIAIQEVSSGAEQQAIGASETSRSVNELVSGIQQIVASSETVSSSASTAKSVSLGGTQSINTAIQQMDSIHTTVGDLAGSVRSLGERSNEIGQIVGVITEIASQTNLLALNAAIEAARAGEQGRGFAVVADEVRKLAEQSADSAKQIVSVITSIQTETRRTVETTDKVNSEVQSGLQLINDAGHAFAAINEAVSHVANQIDEVSAAVEQMAASAEQMAHTAESISSVAIQSSTNTQNVAASTEEQLASMEEITASATSLSQMAEELQVSISRFTL